MIDITSGEAEVLSTRHMMEKKFDIDVTINKETHNLEITVRHEEEMDGSDTELAFIKIGKYSIPMVGEFEDMGEKINSCLDSWFSDTYDLTATETEPDFDLIFEAIWEYVESKDLH